MGVVSQGWTKIPFENIKCRVPADGIFVPRAGQLGYDNNKRLQNVQATKGEALRES